MVILGLRYYDPSVGRFINRDPIDYGGGVNLYAYLHDNPINGADPMGTETLRDLLAHQAQDYLRATMHFLRAARRFRSEADNPRRNAVQLEAARRLVVMYADESGLISHPLVAAPIQLPTGGIVIGGVGGLAALTHVALDTNALVALLEGSSAEEAAVRTAIGYRIPLVSMTAAKEFLVRGDVAALRSFLVESGGRIAVAGGSREVAAGLRQNDARIAASAIREGVQLITRDRGLLVKLPGSAVGF